ncbi:unnamed protein product [Effrenium voratum]|nr:unnamed protein product [Effrenium voratum]
MHAAFLEPEDMARKMPCLRQEGPSCGSTCLSMSLAYFGLHLEPRLIEERIHPYGRLDLGELPSELARFARSLGLAGSRHYNCGSLEEMARHVQKGPVILMLNYRLGTGHLVLLLGVERGIAGEILQLRIRNPWGFDETISARQLLPEWRRLRQSKTSKLGRCLPVFDAGYCVIAASTEAAQNDAQDFWQAWHSGPVDVLIASANGLGGSLATLRCGHVLPGLMQLLGNLLGTLGGLGAYALGNLIGLNLQFLGEDLLESSPSSLSGRALVAISAPFSVTGRCLALAVLWARKVLVCYGEACAGRDALSAARSAPARGESAAWIGVILAVPSEAKDGVACVEITQSQEELYSVHAHGSPGPLGRAPSSARSRKAGEEWTEVQTFTRAAAQRRQRKVPLVYSKGVSVGERVFLGPAGQLSLQLLDLVAWGVSCFHVFALAVSFLGFLCFRLATEQQRYLHERAQSRAACTELAEMLRGKRHIH